MVGKGSKDEATDRLLNTFVLAHDLDAARRCAAENPRDHESMRVVEEEHDVVIGGVRVPRKRN